MESESISFETLSFEEANAKLKEVSLLLKAHELSEIEAKVVENIAYIFPGQGYGCTRNLTIAGCSDKAENVA